MQMRSTRHRPSTRSSWSSSALGDHLSFRDELIWEYADLREVSVYRDISIRMPEYEIGVSSWYRWEDIVCISIHSCIDRASLFSSYIEGIMLTLEKCIIIRISKICGDSIGYCGPLHDIGCSCEYFHFFQYSFIAIVGKHSRALFDITRSFLDDITAIFFENSFEGCIIGSIGFLPSMLYLFLSLFLRVDIFLIEILLSLRDDEEFFSFILLYLEVRSITLEDILEIVQFSDLLSSRECHGIIVFYQ